MSEAITNDYAPGTRWRDKKVYPARDGRPSHRLAGQNPTFIVAATDDWVIFVHHDRDGTRIGGESALERHRFEEKWEPSCCVAHDEEPDATVLTGCEKGAPPLAAEIRKLVQQEVESAVARTLTGLGYRRNDFNWEA